MVEPRESCADTIMKENTTFEMMSRMVYATTCTHTLHVRCQNEANESSAPSYIRFRLSLADPAHTARHTFTQVARTSKETEKEAKPSEKSHTTG